MNTINGKVESSAWSRLRADLRAIIWSSFQATCIATTLFFVVVDPIALAEAAQQPWLQNRITAYGAGFLLFWAATTLSAALISCMVSTDARTYPDSAAHD